MGLADKLVVAGGVALLSIVARNRRREAQETNRREHSPLCFDPWLTQSDFSELVQGVAERTRRVKYANVHGMNVTLGVASISGLTNWSAEIDFNDYGRLTGAYWLHTDNSDSLIPAHVADLVRAQIKSRTDVGLAEASAGSSSEVSGAWDSPAQTAALPSAGWYPDPHRMARLRYWDGSNWTGYVAP